MILNDDDLAKLKELIFGEEDEDNLNKCMECKTDDPEYCNLMSICNRYGCFGLIDGAKDIVKDLFDTLEREKNSK